MADFDEHMPVVNNLPPWVVAMRAAAMKVVKAEDIEAIVRKQVELAKAGDAKALRFVFEHVLGGGQAKVATLIQNNYHQDLRPDRPCRAQPGSPAKIETMRRRVEAGLEPTRKGDGMDGDE